MDLSAALHQSFSHQETESVETMIGNLKAGEENNNNNDDDQKKLRPPESGPQQCPRCESSNTKFCYYNNYSLTQPRYFCKACRRYWTKGGTLRNVPVGGGCRKSAKRAASNSPSHFLKRAHTGESGPGPVFSGYNNFGGFDAGVGNFLGQNQSAVSFLQELQYGNNGSGGFMFQGNYGNYEEVGAGNSNCVSDDVVGMMTYGDVKQEWGSNGISEFGLIANYPALGLLNTW